jgi:ornithine cyclodeaminase/alanine dehydrogenase-like protein (mu-crystallin family)
MSERAAAQTTRYLSESDVAALLPSVAEQIDVVADALTQVAERRAHQPPKRAIETGDSGRFVHLMPAAINGRSGRIVGTKWISGGGGLPISGVLIVEGQTTGVRSLVSAAALTAARTAAVSGAALRAVHGDAFAPSRVALIGGGVQAHSHRAMLAEAYPQAGVSFFTGRAASELPLRAGDRVAERVDDALHGAEVLITAAAFGTPPRSVALSELASGATIIVIDYDSTLRGEHISLLRAHGPVRLMTDSAEQFNATREAGKLEGWLEISEEIGAPGAPEPGAITIVNHLGIAACDLALADLLLERALERGVGTLLPR